MSEIFTFIVCLPKTIFSYSSLKSYFDSSYCINLLCLKPALQKDGYKAIFFVNWTHTKDTALLTQALQPALRYISFKRIRVSCKHLIARISALRTRCFNRWNTQTNPGHYCKSRACLPEHTTSGSPSRSRSVLFCHKIFMQRTASFACHNHK